MSFEVSKSKLKKVNCLDTKINPGITKKKCNIANGSSVKYLNIVYDWVEKLIKLNVLSWKFNYF